MRLRLTRPPTAANAPLFAAETVTSVQAIDGARLDYSVESLGEIDRILGGFHDQGLTRNEIAEACFVFGCYVGEVVVRTAGGTWEDLDDGMQDVFGFPMAVRLPNQNFVNPIAKAFKRVESGPDDSIRYFYQALVSPPR